MLLVHRTAVLTSVMGLLLLPLAGCGGTDPSNDKAATTAHDDHHDHGHDHEHGGGLHEGHLLELGEEEYHAEWTHDDEGLIDIYILDGTAKKEHPIEAAELTIVVQVQEQEPKTYTLPAVDPSGDPPQSAHFSLQDPSLKTMLLVVGEGAEATLSVPIGEETYQAEFPAHEEHDHDHDHGH